MNKQEKHTTNLKQFWENATLGKLLHFVVREKWYESTLN